MTTPTESRAPVQVNIPRGASSICAATVVNSGAKPKPLRVLAIVVFMFMEKKSEQDEEEQNNVDLGAAKEKRTTWDTNFAKRA